MENLIEFLESQIDHNFDPDADWWEWGNVDDAHAHGVEEGFQSAIEAVLKKVRSWQI
jgi:hypothetical protein